MGPRLLPTLIILIAILDTCQEQLWRGVQELRLAQRRGVLGAVLGVIAIGAVAASTSTTITITIVTTTSITTISTATTLIEGRARVIGSTIRNTEATRPMETGKQPTSMAVKVRAGQVALAIDKALELEQLIGQALGQVQVIVLAAVPEQVIVL